MLEVDVLVAMFSDEDLTVLLLVVSLAEAFVRRNRRRRSPMQFSTFPRR